MRVWCPSCKRIEHWTQGERNVEMEGGSRQPTEHPFLAAWHTVRSARSDGHVVVGRCVCEQPLLAASGDWFPWTLDTEQGAFVLNAADQSGPQGPIADVQLEALLESHYGWKLEIKPGQFLFSSTLMMSIVAPAMLWLLALIAVIVFLYGFANQPGFMPS